MDPLHFTEAVDGLWRKGGGSQSVNEIWKGWAVLASRGVKIVNENCSEKQQMMTPIFPYFR